MSRRYVFGRFEVRPDERRVMEAGEPVAIGARAFDLLLALIDHRDRVIGKDELLELVWPGVVVEENNLTVQISALRKLLGTESISTVPGRGYRFTLMPDGGASVSPAPAPADEIDPSLPDKPSIAVLPFTNMSGDPQQEYFTDGITEEIITELSRFRSLFVIARNSSFSYKGKSPDIRAVGKELGVRYVLEGSARKAGNRVRVTGQLIEATTGSHIWAEKYDRVLEDIFAVQEEITRSIVSAIAPHIDAQERSRAQRRPNSVSAYDLALRASAKGYEAHLKSDFGLWARALAEAREALAIDANSVIALEAIARLQARYLFMFMGPTEDARARWQEGDAAATRLIESDPSASMGYTWKAMLLSLAGRSGEALANARRAHELNPNGVVALVTLAYVELMEGEAELALAHASQSIRLSPRDPLHYNTNNIRAAACFLLRRHTEGLDYAHMAVSAAPNYPAAHLNHVLVAVGAGDLAAAREAFETAHRLAPDYIQFRLEGKASGKYHRPDDAHRVMLAFRIAAGLEDPSAADTLR